MAEQQLDLDDIDDDIPENIRIQLEDMETAAGFGGLEAKNHLLQVRRNIEDWREARAMREQIDYLD